MVSLDRLKQALPVPWKKSVERAVVEVLHRLDPERGAPLAGTLTVEQLAFWQQNGYLVLRGFFSAAEVDPITDLVERLWAERAKLVDSTVVDLYIGTPAEQRVLLRDAPPEAKDVPYKINNLYLDHPIVRETVCHPRLAAVLGQLLEGAPLVCNSLCFERGSQQPAHFDTFFMPPPVANRMCASWIALEDATEASGPLFYYPGSHLIRPYLFSHGELNIVKSELPEFQAYIERELAERALQQERFAAKKGDVFIWHAQLFHGGCRILDPRETRRSIVTHYFRAKDFLPSRVVELGPGRHYLKRPHAKAGRDSVEPVYGGIT
jgi:ectoine hydroxylase-related dioxygenase (phytanoyl-CoA dioxygenase family)